MGTRKSLNWLLYSRISWVNCGSVVSPKLFYRYYFVRWTGLHLHIFVGDLLVILKSYIILASPFLDIICRILFIELMFYMILSLSLVVTCCLWAFIISFPICVSFFFFFFVKLHTLYWQFSLVWNESQLKKQQQQKLPKTVKNAITELDSFKAYDPDCILAVFLKTLRINFHTY